uniref:Proteoglycan 4 n=1 Tax=Phallusia mammillata TaxID=59560 RepID=A0A6F9DD20_9ASCI|nr:proteoglycan 4 [Phallusia mammillata]
MSHSPPRAGTWYHPPPQGSSAGPPPMPKPPDRRSPGPPPDWYRWQEYYRSRSPPRHSPPRSGSPPRVHQRPRSRSPRMEMPKPQRPPSPHKDRQPSRRSPSPRSRNEHRPRSPHADGKPPSPRRDRPPSPWDFRRRSPPRSYHRPPPPEWRKRSPSPPPHWVRRSPPRYGPPRGRSPPRGWMPPPPEWDRYRGPPPPGRRSPPRWGPQAPRSWDRRWEPPPPAAGPPGPGRRSPPQAVAPLPPAPVAPAPAIGTDVQKPDFNNPKGDDGILPPGEDKEEEIETFDLPDYDAEVPLGQKYVIAVSGFFCKICHKFYNSEASAKVTHCKSRTHYDKFAKWLSEKQVAALIRKRDAETAAISQKGEAIEETPAKQIKLEPEDSTVSSNNQEVYDPSQPTEEEVNVKKEPDEEQNEINMVPETWESLEVPKMEQIPEQQSDSTEQNGHVSQSSDYNSDSEALITPEVKKDGDGFMEATLYNLRKMKVNQLKANLEKRGLKSTGLKTLLLKRLEKVLMEEAAAAAEAEQSKEEEQTENEEAIGGGEEAAAQSVVKEYTMNIHESDIEATNRKVAWITEDELRNQLTQISGVTNVSKIEMEKSKVGRKTIVEWILSLQYEGEMPEEGLLFSLPSHQQLPFKVEISDDAE